MARRHSTGVCEELQAPLWVENRAGDYRTWTGEVDINFYLKKESCKQYWTLVNAKQAEVYGKQYNDIGNLLKNALIEKRMMNGLTENYMRKEIQ